MTKPQLIVVIGCLFGLAGTLADMFFDAPDYVIFPLLIIGIIIMLIGIRAVRRSKSSTPPQPLDVRWRRFALYLLLAGVGTVVGFLGVHHSHPDFSLGLVVGICGFTLLLCVGIFYWQLFVRAK
jgi:uncharacterized membrane protein YfcA